MINITCNILYSSHIEFLQISIIINRPYAQFFTVKFYFKYVNDHSFKFVLP